MKFGVYQISRRGGREKNEDRMGYCYTREAGLFAVADGMGGHPEGEVASQIVLQTLAAMFQRDARPTLADPAQFLHDGVLIAHQQLLRYGADKGLSDTPRTTVVAAVVQAGQAWWVHCGDSRLYLVRDGQLLARTRDHSYSELQEALGRVGTAGAQFNRNVLFTCLGSPGRPMVDQSGPLALQAGDRLMMCSDGLWGNVSDEKLVSLLAARGISEAVPDMVELALRHGGERCDNVTALAVEWEGDAEPEHAVSTRDLDGSGFASTIQAAAGEQDLRLEMDEEEIERSVREIQEAIRQSRALRKNNDSKS